MDSSVITTAAAGLLQDLTPVAVLGVVIAMAVWVVRQGLWLFKSLILYPMRERRGDYD